MGFYCFKFMVYCISIYCLKFMIIRIIHTVNRERRFYYDIKYRYKNFCHWEISVYLSTYLLDPPALSQGFGGKSG